MPKTTKSKPLTTRLIRRSKDLQNHKVMKLKPKTAAKKRTAKQAGSLLSSVLLNQKGENIGHVDLPKEIFAVSVKPQLLAQAVRVHQINLRQGTQSTKTRGEVTGSTRKIYRQKGTGRARHGSITAPIFVGGGIVFGPNPRSFVSHLPQKMRRKALLGSLTEKTLSGSIRIIKGLGNVSGKTKDMISFLKMSDMLGKKMLLIIHPDMKKCFKSARNITGITVRPVYAFSTTDVIENECIVFAQEAFDQFTKPLNQVKSL